MKDKPFQRLGSNSNAHVGKEFELKAKNYFASSLNIHLEENYKIEVGVGLIKKSHSFDLGCSNQKILVECKSHRWTVGGNVPSAKLTVWNEAMYYFLSAPDEYRKIMFVLHDYSERRKLSLTNYYLNTFPHLIPKGIEFWDYDEIKNTAEVTIK